MARTAPVPNIPAPPGMNPGAFVAGGGGDGGGKGGKGGKGGNGKEGAGDGDGDEDGSGDGNDGGCAEGDPVCPITGRMFVDFYDFGFGAPAPLRWLRSYSSRTSDCRADLGYGWTHPYGWRIVARRRAFHVFDDRGREQLFRRRPSDQGPITNGLGWTLSALPEGLRLTRQGQEYTFSDERAGSHWLLAVVDRNGNATRLERNERGHLTGLMDSAGRKYRVTSTASGQISRIEVETAPGGLSWMRVVDYRYDNDENLVCATDAEGYEDRYDYTNHLMTEHRTATGLVYFYRYDGKDHRAFVIESWGEFPGKRDAALAEGFPRPGKRGIHHRTFLYDKPERYSEVEDSLGGVTRYFGDAAGRVVRIVRPSGAVEERQFHPETGELVEESDAHGVVREVEVDGTRKPTYQSIKGIPGVGRFHQPDGTEVTFNELSTQVVARRYDARGNLVFARHPDGTWEEWGYDQRGLTTYHVARNGARTSYEHDARGQLVLTSHPNGDVERREYDYLSRPTLHVGASGERTEWRYDKRGEIVYKKHPDGSEIWAQYDPIRRPTLLNEAGRVTRYEYGGMAWLTRVIQPNGTAFEMRYDTEGYQREVANPDGQIFLMEYDVAGFLVKWKTFEGISYSQGHDLAGNITWFESPIERTEVVRNELANVEALSTAEDSVSFEYSHLGVSLIDNGVVPLKLAHDVLGRVVSECQGPHEVKLAWSGGNLSQISADIGEPVQFERLPSGRVGRITVGRLELRPQVPNGNSHIDYWDNKLIVRREYTAAGALSFLGVARFTDNADPAYMATGRDPNSVFWAVFRYDQRKNLTSEEWHDGTRIEYELDANDQVRKVVRYGADGREVSTDVYAYSLSGSVRVPGASYDSAGRIASLRGESFEYDSVGRLVKRISDQGITEYRWNGLDHLVEVITPQVKVAMDYDARGRRMRKRVLNSQTLVSDTSYVWSNETLLHEKNELDSSTRTYVKSNEDWETLGQADSLGTTVAYLVHPNRGTFGAVSLDGRIVWLGRPALFGEFEPEVSEVVVSGRMLNQHYDPDVGLTYNRHRWYHAPSGQFVTADPLFLNGSTNPRDYALNPLTQVDPSGLTHSTSGNPLPGDSPTSAPSQITNTSASAAYLSGPGAWATAGAPGGPPGFADCPINGADGRAALDRRSFGSAQAVVDAAGTAYGCHSCGAKSSGYPNNADGTQHWTCDHQPPVCAYKDTGKGGRRPGGTVATGTSGTAGAVRLYPHCKKCSNAQRNALSQQTSTPQGQAALSQVALAQMQHNLTNPAPVPPIF